MLIARYLYWAFVGVLLGIFLVRFVGLVPMVLAVPLLIVASISTKRLKMIGFLFLLLGVGIGGVRAQAVIDDFAVLQRYEGQRTAIRGTIRNDPVYHESGQYQFHIHQLEIDGKSTTGEIRVRSFVNDISKGDVVRVEGKVRDGFASWQASMYFADTKLVDADTSILAKWRANFIAGTYSSLPDPEASLGLGFLMGIRTLLPEELDEQLSVTGLTHIVAVSGYNLTILASVSRRIFEKRSRFMAVAATTMLLVGFIALIGISPSVLRAVIVSGLSLGAWYYGRQLGPWRLLLYSSAVSAFIQPQYVWSSIGWYLSLAAFFGVLVIAPAVKKKLYGKREPRLIMQILIETTAAQFATAPIIMFIFGEVSVISLIANALVLPLIPIAMLTTFVGGLATSLPAIISWPVIQLSYIILQYITSVISILSELSWALVDLKISAIQMSILYASLAVSYLGLRKQRNPTDLV